MNKINAVHWEDPWKGERRHTHKPHKQLLIYKWGISGGNMYSKMPPNFRNQTDYVN